MAAYLASRLWFTIPSHSPASAGLAGGVPFQVGVDGRLVRGAVWGEGPVVYLVHGWAGDSRQMTPLVAPLVAAGHRVVAFDGPSHGRSDPGASGRGRSHAVEFADALAAVAARHGPARVVVAHSMGAMATMLTLRSGRLSAARLVFVAPMHELRSYLDRFAAGLNLGRRARRRLDASLEAHVGMLVEEFALLSMAEQAGTPPPAGRPRPQRPPSGLGRECGARRPVAGRPARHHRGVGPQSAARRSRGARRDRPLRQPLASAGLSTAQLCAATAPATSGDDDSRTVPPTGAAYGRSARLSTRLRRESGSRRAAA